MRAPGKIVVATLLALLVPTGIASAAFATAPPALERSSYVTDISGVLAAEEEASVNEHLRDVAESTGVELYFVFVPEFSDPAIDTRWVSETAEINGLAAHQYLIGVATEARMFAIDGTRDHLSDAQQGEVTDAMRPFLRQDDWAGAIVAAADEVQELLVERPARTARTWLIIAVVLVGAAALVILLVVVRRLRRRAAAKAAREAELQDLGQRANIALVRTDDLVRTSEQELEFARAQFGDDSIGEFVQALAIARRDLNEAFSLKQQLEDEIPDSEQEREEWNTRIIDLCTASTQALEERKADFDALRKLEQNAPAALENVRRLRADADAEVDRAQQILGTLQSAYAASAIAAIMDNPTQARTRIALTDESIKAADAAILAGRTGDAAVAIRAAEAAVQQATQLEDAVEALANDLAEAEKQTHPLVTDVQDSIKEAEGLAAADARIEAVIGSTRTQLVAAQALLGTTGRNPVEALRMLEAANIEVDTAVQRVRDEQARIAHARTMLDGALRRADTQIGAAESFIAHRRGAIGQLARTALSEAGTQRAQARELAGTDPVAALALARRADTLASEALRRAQYDVNAWNGRNDDTLGAFLSGVFLGQSSSASRRGHGGGYSGSSLFGGSSSGRSSSSGWSSSSSRSSSSGGGFGVGGFGGSRSSFGSRSSSSSRSSRSGGRF